MKSFRPHLLGLALLTSGLAAPTTLATGPDAPGEPLWRRAQWHVRDAHSLVASRVVTQVTVRDGNDVLLGSIESVEVVAWKEHGPVWVNVAKKTSGTPGFTMELNLHIEDNPGNLLDGYDTWTAKGETSLGGRRLARWEGRAAGPEGRRALAYLDPETARPWRVDLELPIRSNLGTRSLSVTVLFGPGPQNTWVPLGASIDQSGRFMFWKRHLVIAKSFQDWAWRPAQ